MAWLTAQARPYIGRANVIDARLEAWTHARPLIGHPDRCAVVAADPLVVLAGDGFGGAKVEGAALSGLAAADVVLGR